MCYYTKCLTDILMLTWHLYTWHPNIIYEEDAYMLARQDSSHDIMGRRGVAEIYKWGKQGEIQISCGVEVNKEFWMLLSCIVGLGPWCTPMSHCLMIQRWMDHSPNMLLALIPDFHVCKDQKKQTVPFRSCVKQCCTHYFTTQHINNFLNSSLWDI